MKKEILFSPAFDKRSADPKKNYGIHGVTLYFYLTGEAGTVQFVVYTGWHLPNVQAEIDARPISKEFPFLSHKPVAADLGYHSKKPQYDRQATMDSDCRFTDGKCYYDGSTLNAEPIFDTLTKEGSDGVWSKLEDYYSDVFGELIMSEIEQDIEIVEKLLDKDFVHGIDKLTMYLQEGHSVDIKQAFRDFIESTREDE